jgi:hypothetical protein
MLENFVINRELQKSGKYDILDPKVGCLLNTHQLIAWYPAQWENWKEYYDITKNFHC